MSDTTYQNLNKQFIKGQWREGQSSKKIDNINPFTQELIFTATAASQADVDEAFSVAQDTFTSFSTTSASERKALVDKFYTVINARREEITDWLIKESGSTHLKAGIEIQSALNMTQEAATFPDRMETMDLPNKAGLDSRSYRQALGVIGVISPWNFPFHLTIRSVITALAIGNTVVIKPASDTMVTGGTLIAKLCEEAGFPAGSVNVVAGAGSEIGDYFVSHAIPKMISFTGSTNIGKRVGELAVGGKYLKRIALELGGNAPLLVLDDADLDMAVELTVMGRFLHQGQICMSTNRVIIDEKIHDNFIEKLLKRLDTVVAGNPADKDTLIGPIINAQQLQNLKQIIEKGKESGATLVYSRPIEGNIIPPHVFINVDTSSDLAMKESFGPVLPIIKSRDDAHAIQLANSTEYGLSSAICTSDEERGVRLALQIDAGMTHINSITVADQPNAPFGGEKNSGLGRFNGQWILEEFSRTHWITVQ